MIDNQQINGKYLYYAFVSGGNMVLQNQIGLNEINVFPVRDKDTGTNLASTVRMVIDSIKPEKSYKKTINNIAEAALQGARGNSGIIFAQFLYGLAKETEDKISTDLHEFAISVKNSIPYVYKAIANPVEGTMLTVINEWSEYLDSKKNLKKEFKSVFIDSIEVLEKSLEQTSSKLKILDKYHVVDAGAKGFVLFIKGVIDFVLNRNIRELSINQTNTIELIHEDEHNTDEITYRYCTEAVLKNMQFSTDALKDKLEKDGDSVVVAGDKDMCRIHIHTNEPAKLFHKLHKISTITYQKVDDMVRQNEIASNRKWNIAVVTDSTCDLDKDLIDKYQINLVPLNLNFGENQYLDKVSIQPEQFYDLLEKEEVFPKSSQINETTFTNVYSQLSSHYDAIISLHLTSKFSGTYQSSKSAAKRVQQEFGKPIFVFDSSNLSGALGLMVLKTAMSIEEGLGFEEITHKLTQWKEQTEIFVSVANLKYMLKGGRVSGLKGKIASMLNLNPVISMDKQGNSTLFGTTLNQKSSLKKIFKHIEKIKKDKEVWNYIVLHANNSDGAKLTSSEMQKITGKKPLSVVDISPIIGMHAGIGANAVSIMFEN